MNPEYFKLHARKFYEAAKSGNCELAEWEAQLLVQPFIRQDEEAAKRTVGSFGGPVKPETTGQRGGFAPRKWSSYSVVRRNPSPPRNG